MSSSSNWNVRPVEQTGKRRLSPEEMAEAFADCSRTLWCIAAGILGRSEQIEDVLQEAAMVALNKLDQFEPDTSFVAWTGRIVRFVALNHARRRQRNPVATRSTDLLEASASGGGSGRTPATSDGRLQPDQESFDDEVLAALKTLDETARACLLLRTILDLPYREISLALDIPEGTAMSHVHRARHALRHQLQERDAHDRPEGDRPRKAGSNERQGVIRE
jgi:RNA polymerase sigma-70 factor (ECF subfamily)